MKKTVFINGCFDVLHVGHARILRFAASLGDLVVGVNSDESVRTLKGASRPRNVLADRIEMIKYIVPGAHVSSFSDLTPVAMMKCFRPNIYVLGNEAHKKNIPEIDYARSIGCVVVYFPYIAGQSTSRIIQYSAVEPDRVALWEAINELTVARGGRSDVINDSCMDAVTKVEAELKKLIMGGVKTGPDPDRFVSDRADVEWNRVEAEDTK